MQPMESCMHSGAAKSAFSEFNGNIQGELRYAMKTSIIAMTVVRVKVQSFVGRFTLTGQDDGSSASIQFLILLMLLMSFANRPFLRCCLWARSSCLRNRRFLLFSNTLLSRLRVLCFRFSCSYCGQMMVYVD